MIKYRLNNGFHLLIVLSVVTWLGGWYFTAVLTAVRLLFRPCAACLCIDVALFLFSSFFSYLLLWRPESKVCFCLVVSSCSSILSSSPSGSTHQPTSLSISLTAGPFHSELLNVPSFLFLYFFFFISVWFLTVILFRGRLISYCYC